jgi:hypothetical protein
MMGSRNNVFGGLKHSSNMKNRTGRFVKALIIGLTCLSLTAAAGCNQAKGSKTAVSVERTVKSQQQRAQQHGFQCCVLRDVKRNAGAVIVSGQYDKAYHLHRSRASGKG